MAEKNERKGVREEKPPLCPDLPHLLDLAALLSSESSQISGMEGKKPTERRAKIPEDDSAAGTDRPKVLLLPEQDRASPKTRNKILSPAPGTISSCPLRSPRRP